MEEYTFNAKRRNLLLVAFFLFFINYAGVEIQNLVATSMLLYIKKPEVILQAVWILWGYLFIRAYQYYRYYLELEYQRSIQKTVAPILHKYIIEFAVPTEHERFFFEDIERFHRYELRFYPNCIFTSPLFFLTRFFRHLTSKPHFKQDPKRILRYRINFLRYRRVKWLQQAPSPFWKIIVWTITDRTDWGGGKMPIEVVCEKKLGLFKGMLLKARITLTLLLISAPFFEYRLPFILALAPVPYFSVDFQWRFWFQAVLGCGYG